MFVFYNKKKKKKSVKLFKYKINTIQELFK